MKVVEERDVAVARTKEEPRKPERCNVSFMRRGYAK